MLSARISPTSRTLGRRRAAEWCGVAGMSCGKALGTPKPSEEFFWFFGFFFLGGVSRHVSLPLLTSQTSQLGFQNAEGLSKIPAGGCSKDRQCSQNWLLQLLSNFFPTFIWKIFSRTKVLVLTTGQEPTLALGLCQVASSSQKGEICFFKRSLTQICSDVAIWALYEWKITSNVFFCSDNIKKRENFITLQIFH